MTEWFEQWFGEEYHVPYPHRDEEDARRLVALLRHAAPWAPGDTMLVCEEGRYMVKEIELRALLDEAGFRIEDDRATRTILVGVRR